MKWEGKSLFLFLFFIIFLILVIHELNYCHFHICGVLHIVECIVIVQEMVEYITLHMGSANNCDPSVFKVYSFCISSFNTENSFS